jgi:hypothetical protein
MKKSIVLLLSLIIWSAFASSPTESPQSTWSLLTTQALNDIHDELANNHPGAIDSQNPQFKIWLEEGYKTGLQYSKQVASFSGLKTELLKYINGFQDGHIFLNFKIDEKTVSWAGIILRSSIQAPKVQFIDHTFSYTGLKVGDELITCDGKSPEEIFRTNILPVKGIKGLAASYRKLIPFLFVDDASVGSKSFSSCMFSNHSIQKQIKMQYKNQSRYLVGEKLNEKSGPMNHSFGISKIGSSTAWISFPSFGASDEKGLKKLKQTITDAKKLRKLKNIIIDLRGNSGGNSQWGDDLLASIYSNEFFIPIKTKLPEDSNIEYRVSKDNLEYVGKMLTFLKSQVGEESEITKTINSVQIRMTKALLNKQNFVKEGEKLPTDISKQAMPPQFKGQLLLLTDYKCFSSCLLFMDEVISLIPNAVHVGLETDADTAYMEIKPSIIANGVAELMHPIKVNRIQVRQNNEPYFPKHKFDGDIYDDRAVQNWVLSFIK